MRQMLLGSRCCAAVCALVIGLLALTASPAGALWLFETRLTNDPSLSLTSSNNAWCVAFDSADNINVVWTDYRAGFAGVFHKSFDGSAWGPDSSISLQGTAADNPSVCGDAAGKVHATWTDYRHGNSEIYYRAFDGAGWGTPERISSSSSLSLRPSIAADDSGNVHIVWHDYRNYDWEIYYGAFDGAVWFPEQRLTDQAGNSEYASVAVAGNGNVHVVWQDERDGNYEIYYKIYDGTWSADERLTVDAGASEQPSVAVSAAGNIHVVWSDDRDGASEIYHKIRLSGVWGSDERLTNEPEASTAPSVAADDSGGVHVVWKDERHGNQEIYYKHHDGLAWGPEERLSNNDGVSEHASIAAGSGDELAMVWQDNREGNSEIYARRFVTGSFPPPSITSITPAAGYADSVTTITDLAGEAFLYNAAVLLQLPGEPDIAATNIVVESAEKISCELNLTGASPGFWDVVVENPDGQRDTLPEAFGIWHWPDVAVLSVDPQGGFPGQHIDELEILGFGFLPTPRVRLKKLGQAPILASGVVVHSTFRITCDIALPTSGIGPWDVEVENPNLEMGTLAGGFLLAHLDAPDIAAIYPFEGVAGEHVVITDLAGENFHELATVWLHNSQYGILPAEDVVVESPEKITFEMDLPEAYQGYFDVVVMHPDGVKDTLLSGFRIIQGEWGAAYRLTDAVGASNLSKGNARCLAADSLGNLHAVWFDERHGDSEIYYRMYDGVSWGAEERITTSANESENPAIAVGADNTVYIFWADRMRGDWEIYYIFKDLSGWSEIQCLTDAQDWVNHPSVATDTNNDIHVVWEAYDLSYGYQIIYSRTLDSVWQPPDSLSLPYNHRYPAIAIDGTNAIHVAWRLKPSSDACIRYTRSDGESWEPDVSLVCRPEMGAPSLCADADGKLHLAFHDQRFGNFEVFYKQFDGSDWLPAVRLSDAPAKSFQPSVVSDGAGGVTVVWSDERHADYTYEIYSRRLDGPSWGPEGRLTYAPGTSSIYPSGALDMAGAFHVIWSDDRDGNFEIYHKIRGEDASAGIGDEPLSKAQAGPLQVLPNPFMGSVEIRLARPAREHAVISIYDVSGRLVWERQLAPDAGNRPCMVWNGLGSDGRRVAPGVYLVRLKSSKQTSFTKIVMVK